MGIIDTIKRSKDDLIRPKHKSYWGYNLEIDLLDVEKLSKKINLLPSEKRLVTRELSGKEPVEEVIVLKNSKKSLGRLTTNQVKDILDDLGFNVDTILSGANFSDFSAVMNIGGYAIPGWVYLARSIAKLFPSSEKVMLLKLAPGKDRLHIRVFEMNDGSWAILAHTDHNWMSLNLIKVYKAHARVGAGDYLTGTLMANNLLNFFAQSIKENKIMKLKEIERITRASYNKSILEKIGKLISYA